ncbi:dihydroorotate dehydrogenase-like protein [Methylacidimicrobium sp. B4]|uniref:dihydroorotate dehydrogenase-like protein n=1 Tax=Methylacidimicrobium sp. B4 TaxID=2796139 RepID=UPI001A8BF64F|nr:dihydroorotate dehydrogenase-like protein [Methylacidimicrobium sp. B4]QSR84375.1 dihydroorotate dehydrogenase-like protein [Methylacidimicrobium sp. B4]
MNLATRYMGLSLQNPLIASASPLTGELDAIRRLEDAEAGAVVLPSIFEEQIRAEQERWERLTAAGTESFPEALTYFPDPSAYRVGPDRYLELIREAVEAVDIPIVASLNGVTSEGWISYAQGIEEAGADGLELNIYFLATDLSEEGQAVEERYLQIVRTVRAEVSLPLAVKLLPAFSSLGNMARRLIEAGAQALVLFNRFYQPEIDLAALRLVDDLVLSHRSQTRLPLFWIRHLRGQIDGSLAASSGVESAREAIQYLLAGADVVMTTSALLREGIPHMKRLVGGLRDWMEEHGFVSVDAIRGLLSREHLAKTEPAARARYIDILQRYPAEQGLWD